MFKPFLVTNRVSNKTLGAVYAASLQSAQDIAGALWEKDKEALFLLDFRKELDGGQTTLSAH